MTTPLEFLHTALCSAPYIMGGSGCRLDYDAQAYADAKKRLQREGTATRICIEDILIEMISNGDDIYIHDMEGDDEKTPINLEKLNETFKTKGFSDERFMEMISDFMNGNDDAITAWDFLQYVAYGESIFG